MSKRYARALCCLVLAVVTLTVPYGRPAYASHGTTDRASLTSSGGQAGGSSASPAVSADGRYVAFASWATNLVAGDTNGWVDIFVRDLTTGATERVSISSAGAQADGPSLDATISADGRYVAFWSLAGNLATPFTAAGAFVRDRVKGTTVRASVSAAGFPTLGENPSISGDGRYVAFWARWLTDDRWDIGVRDLVTEQTTVVRADSLGMGSGPSLSADGRFVAFSSNSPDLVSGDTNEARDVFVHDRLTGTTERVSVSTSGRQDPTGPGQPSITADGRYIAFEGSGALAEPATWRSGIFVRDRLTGTTTLVSTYATGEVMEQAHSPSISADGTRLSFVSSSTEESRQAWPVLSRIPPTAYPNTAFQILPSHVYVRDLRTGVTSLASVSTGGQRGDESSRAPRLSADGGIVAFESWAANLVRDDTNDAQDIFVHDFTPGAPTCSDGSYEEGPVSGRLHEEIEPSAGPAAQPLHNASCALLVPRGL